MTADFLPSEAPDPEESFSGFEGVSYQALVRERYKEWLVKSQGQSGAPAQTSRGNSLGDGLSEPTHFGRRASSKEISALHGTLHKLQMSMLEICCQVKRLADKLDGKSSSAGESGRGSVIGGEQGFASESLNTIAEAEQSSEHDE